MSLPRPMSACLPATAACRPSRHTQTHTDGPKEASAQPIRHARLLRQRRQHSHNTHTGLAVISKRLLLQDSKRVLLRSNSLLLSAIQPSSHSQPAS